MTLRSFPSCLKIGTRGSALALTQANLVKEALLALYPELSLEIVIIKTSGDIMATEVLADIGGKGLFIKEIEEALLTGYIDIAVHSIKDMPASLDDRLELTTVLPREDVRDILLAFNAPSIKDLPKGSYLGSSSPRRTAQILYQRPDIHVTHFRGNVPTRIEKFKQQSPVTSTVLALAGIKRLNCFDASYMHLLSLDEMLPAIGQGAIGLEIRKDNILVQELIAPLNHTPSAYCVHAERIFLGHFETSSCRTPIAAHAYNLDASTISFTGLIATPDGTIVHKAIRKSSSSSIYSAALEVAYELSNKAGDRFFG